jgi:hypothetical protein
MSSAEVNARIVYWGIEGAGKRTNLEVIHAKLRPDHRGELRELPTRLDPTVCYAMLPIELGEVSGVRTRIQVLTAPAGAEQAPTRKQLLDRVDGVVFVADARREKLSENLACFEELRAALAAYGRPLEQVPLVLQYNKRDLADPYALEELHRKLGVRGAAAFEAVAREGNAVLQTLTTISKRVIRHRREEREREAEPLTPPPGTSQLFERVEEGALAREDEALPLELEPAPPAPEADAEPAFDTTAWGGEPSAGAAPAAELAIEEAGPASVTGPRTVSLPVCVRDASGARRQLVLRIQLEALEEPAP